MEIGLPLFFIGAFIIIASQIIFVIKAFQESMLWGLGVIVIPVVDLLFLISYWSEAKNPFLCGLFGVALAIGGLMISPEAIEQFVAQAQ